MIIKLIVHCSTKLPCKTFQTACYRKRYFTNTPLWLFCFHFSKNERFANEDSQISDTDSDSDDEDEDKINVNIREIDTDILAISRIPDEERSTHFIAIRITNPDIVKAAKSVQEDVVSKEEALADCCMGK